MKVKLLSFICCFILFFSISVQNVSASSISSPKNKPVIEYLEDGSYIVTEWLDFAPSARSSTYRTKIATYYSGYGSSVFSVSLTGYFTYTYGSSARASSQSVSVNIYDNSASYISKSSSHSGATVYGSGTVSFGGVNRTVSLQISCDIYGNTH